MKLLYRHYKLTTERNRHSQRSGPLGSGPIGPSGYSVMPAESRHVVHHVLFYRHIIDLISLKSQKKRFAINAQRLWTSLSQH